MATSENDRVHLPLVSPSGAPTSSLNADGTRNFVHVADVRGRFNLARRAVFYALIAFWAVLPWVKVGGHPAVFVDVEHRKFFLFGATFNAQDIWLVFFLLTGVAFALLYATAVAGRVWCGWACPQTVFLEGLYRPIERLTEGSREKRIRLAKAPFGLEKLLRKGAKHAIYAALSILVAHIFVSYFVSIPRLWHWIGRHPAEHPEAFAWAAGVTAVLYVNFAWFREQLCIIVCPYGRLQSVLVDADSITIGYDEKRGEPRGKVGVEGAGACVDCKRCIVVCPTAIDIRNGMQLDCLGCTACIDACDEVMDKLGRPRGLIRYDSLNGLMGRPKRFLRPRLYVYGAFGLLGLAVAAFSFHKHVDFEANVLRLPGLPYIVDDKTIRDAFEIHLVNKRAGVETFLVEPEPVPGVEFIVPLSKIELASLASAHAPLFVVMDRAQYHGDFPVTVRVRRAGADDEKGTVTVVARFLGPSLHRDHDEHHEEHHDEHH
jgi:cytochrome c oxidase accessory protein FixG